MSASKLYEPLHTATSTRIVSLYPGPGHQQLSASLIQVNLLDSPFYEAVSYTWGPPHNKHIIIVNGHPILIRKNLHDALIRLRPEDTDRQLWIDALSISQADLQEKAQQVQMIGEIFKGAQRVLAWVGEHADESENVFDELRRNQVVDPTVDRSARSPFPAPRYSTLNVLDSDFNEEAVATDPRLTAWNAFLSRDYWSRTWIIQELCIARKVVIHCGNCQEGLNAFLQDPTDEWRPGVKPQMRGFTDDELRLHWEFNLKGHNGTYRLE
jgi:Heterokaryon incompatibility protein (HET)